MAKVVPRPEYIRVALESVRGLLSVLPQLSEAELLEVLRVESQSSRRRSHMDRVVSRLVATEADRYRIKLVEEFYDGSER